ncbi:MAG: tRNA (adenosine(37)-N6)-threonylcarbamoyltransferase complex dimerization subunit type 1 TsaB [Bacteroidota bacterium]|nr:tRNA (adenosine(37)-N6)-threonylcarbamoyltransferase complex dimerization subunit type 1 TsaB [Bacteroidota bacterium]
MKILGIETATMVCAAAVIEDDNVLAERKLLLPQMHSEKLVDLIDDCLRTAQLDTNTIDGIAVSIGPGSFTGLRIGLSVAKGLSFTSGKPIIGVPTLHGLAHNAIQQKLCQSGDIVIPMIDARRDEIYAAGYRVDNGNLDEISAASAISLGACIDSSREHQRVLVVGDGAEKFMSYLEKVELEDSSRYIIPPAEYRHCSAAAIASLGALSFLKGVRDDVETLEPFYVKDFYTLVKTQHQEVKQ